MKLYSVGVRGGLKRISKAEFKEDNVYLIDDFKTIYVWFGSNISKKRKDITIKKANLLNEKKEKTANLQIIDQNKEYGAFIVIKDFLYKGIKQKKAIERRAELKIQIEETMELIEAGLNPDLEAEITIAANDLSKKKESYKDLCETLAQLQLELLKGPKKTSKDEIQIKTQEIFKSSSTYEELCWLIAQLKTLVKKKSLS
jgi:hypothetical protein